ncbi:hypothetical protein SK355_00770 [Candidatus Fukatsuia symbiotica]|uniref:Transcriptional regulator n=1 Tax=Candidatus Fukatsuia symbiotica TaxID=1878942 RepID=A0A2U8IAC9_9GAMM|nr:hypothetical protein [Candidatus Fukatsuia symbiotica]AWK15085.1 hypothetical protein CCS41_12365 [Candidatus Fukatsuia symbiotica]MEA9443892.1 hypothetical protein [Candidatus Fukatsuia symbiotica]
MEMKEIRRQRLKKWFENRPLPQREKSYFSQIINGKASFGERAARRIERAYGMEYGYLDMHIDTNQCANSPVVLSQRQKILLDMFDGLPKIEQQRFLQEITDRKNEIDQLVDEMMEKYGLNKRA